MLNYTSFTFIVCYFSTRFDSNNFVYIYILGYVTFAPESIIKVAGINRLKYYFCAVLSPSFSIHQNNSSHQIGGQWQIFKQQFFGLIDIYHQFPPLRRIVVSQIWTPTNSAPGNLLRCNCYSFFSLQLKRKQNIPHGITEFLSKFIIRF